MAARTSDDCKGPDSMAKALRNTKTEMADKRRAAAKRTAKAPETALAKVPADGMVHTQIPTTAKQIAKYQALAEKRRPTFEALAAQTLDGPDDIAFVSELLTEVVQLEDAAKVMRGSATGPLYGVIRTVESWFRPYLEELLYAKGVCKKLIGDARIAQIEVVSGARELAADAAKVGDAETVVEALNVASEAAKPDGAAAKSTLHWAIARVAPDLLPEFLETSAGSLVGLWRPDTEAIQAYADQHDGGGPAPVVPGVVFERVARVGAKH